MTLDKKNAPVELNLIVCLGKDNLLGDASPEGNGLLWHSAEELRYYKSRTVGNVVLFGLTTAQFAPLQLMKKNRTVEVLDFGMDIDGILAKYADSGKSVFICGGYSIYKFFLENYALDHLYISRLKPRVPVAEAKSPLYFPDPAAFGYKLAESVEHEDFFAEVWDW
ncbi:MAG: dihydrofolate reductase [Fusobacteriaceae bacterium]|jgi:dihydrofolate reductase|nr:dihydrofolate reductase [Fusobacteriaceae bacterium]